MDEVEKFFEEIKLPPVTYGAVFDPLSGAVTAVGPIIALKDEKNLIPVDKNIAEMIIEGSINISHCAVDIRNMTFELVERKTVSKIDDVLHRIISKQYSTNEFNDVYLTYNSVEQTLTIELADFLGGTYISGSDLKPRKIVWDGETDLVFLVSEYNDPNLLLDTFFVKINELTGASKVIKNFDHTNFSIYTRRLFKHYVIETK